MRAILKSVFGKNDESLYNDLKLFLAECAQYESEFNYSLLKEKEVEAIEYLIKDYNLSLRFSTEDLFCQTFTEYIGTFNNIPDISADDLRTYMMALIDKRADVFVAKRVQDLAVKIQTTGVDEVAVEQFEFFRRASRKGNVKSFRMNIDGRTVYEEMEKRPAGMTTGIKEIDEKIGGMNEGTITTLAGFTSHFKSTFALNIAYNNAYFKGYNIAYITLETPSEDIQWNLLSRHSYDPMFTKSNFLPHDKIRKVMLSKDEKDWLFDEIEKDLKGTYKDADGNDISHGQIIFIDESDFTSFSFSEITALLEHIDDELNGNLDAVIVDYVQLCKFSDVNRGREDNKAINMYVTFFRRLCQRFRSGSKKKKLIGILLSQVNRENWKRARNNEGRYDLTCLADANELERGSHRVLTTYTNEDLKGRKSAQVQILKNRNGMTMYEPVTVFADGECYMFGEEIEGFGQTFGGNSSMSLSDAFDSIGDLDALLG